MNHPSLSSRGKQIAGLFAIVVVLALPKRVECTYPGDTCSAPGTFNRMCTESELEPFGFYLIELVAKTDVGFAYSTRRDCR